MASAYLLPPVHFEPGDNPQQAWEDRKEPYNIYEQAYKFIVRNSGVQEYLIPGDVIMADRGFSLEPYLEAQGIKLNMPAFTKVAEFADVI
ncbi:hypothetical protein MTO96_049863 [Rhipicephalus appendiculatus]